MKQIPVDECPAGSWLNVAVAIAQGWKYHKKCDRCFISPKHVYDDRKYIGDNWDSTQCHPYIEDTNGNRYSLCPDGHSNSLDIISLSSWSTDIASAWELVELEKMAVIPLKNDQWLAIPYSAIPDDYTTYKIDLTDGEIASTAPLAITRAYLKARGVEFVEIPEELCDD